MLRGVAGIFLAGSVGCLAAGSWVMFQGNRERTGACEAPGITKSRVLWKTYIGFRGI